MKHLTEAPDICDSTLALCGAQPAYWAALPPALQALLSQMVMWLRACCPVFDSAGSGAANIYALSASMDVEALAKRARQFNQDNGVFTGSADRYLCVRKLSLVTALYGFTPPRAGYLLGFRRAALIARLRARRGSIAKRLRRARLRKAWAYSGGLCRLIISARALPTSHTAGRAVRLTLKPP